jgi:hypothetical protein
VFVFEYEFLSVIVDGVEIVFIGIVNIWIGINWQWIRFELGFSIR